MPASTQTTDLLVIGGGINGAAIARDAVGRGLRVMLAERDDYAAATSSASSKLIHGGLRYLEHYEFSLVRESLHERETILRTAPHLVSPMRFLTPITKDQSRPAWLVRAGLVLYDLMSGRGQLERSGRLTRHQIEQLPRLKLERMRAVLHYPDCLVDDARLVLEILLDARSRGADVSNCREVIGVHPAENGYHVQVRERGSTYSVHARFVVNATGPWANITTDCKTGPTERHRLRLVRGSHIVLKMPDPADETAFTLQNSDGRVVFTIPWLDQRYLVIGTTDAPHDGDPAAAQCSTQERDYLLACYNRYFQHPHRPAQPDDIVWTWAGVRPLVDDGETDPSKLTRGSQMTEERRGTGGWITLYGGKLTTHRRLAEKVLARLQKLGAAVTGEWTSNAPLHGGEMAREALIRTASSGPQELAPDIRHRWAFTYGSEMVALFERIARNPSTTRLIVPGLPEAELHYAAEIEDARTAEDFLYRRTKLFIDMSEADRQAVDLWFEASTSP